jgi:sulfatase modifying factor 1
MSRKPSPVSAETTEWAPPGGPPYPNMVWVPGGTFRMGSDHHYPEEAPAHSVRVDGFWMDSTPVTNEQFARFVRATSYVTFAEIPPRAEEYPVAQPELLHPGSLVFLRVARLALSRRGSQTPDPRP